jgi:hypothetical protein
MKHDPRLTHLFRTVSPVLIVVTTIGCASQKPASNDTPYLPKPEGVVNSGAREGIHGQQMHGQAEANVDTGTTKRNSEATSTIAKEATKPQRTADDNVKLEGDDVKLEGDDVKLEGN